VWRKDVKGICKQGQLQCKPKSISTILKFQNKKFCGSRTCSMSLFASIMSLHLAFLHAADTSFATLIVWKLVANAVLTGHFTVHIVRCVTWIQLRMPSAQVLAVTVFEALCLREVSWASKKQHWHNVCYLQQSESNCQWWCHWWFGELQLCQLSWCLITVERSVFKIHSSTVFAPCY
jgi:hypothetical protein